MTGRHDDGTPSELRELAEDAIDRNDRWILGRGDGIEQSQATALARGLLSALDALEAARKEGHMTAAERNSWKAAAEACAEDCAAAEASRDQAIKERDRPAEALREAEVVRLAAAGTPQERLDLMGQIARAALAGVPEGSPEEHNSKEMT